MNTFKMFIAGLIMMFAGVAIADDTPGDLNYPHFFEDMSDDLWGESYSRRGGSDYLGGVYSTQGMDIMAMTGNVIQFRYTLSGQIDYWDQIYVYNNDRRLVGVVIHFSGVEGNGHANHIRNVYTETTDAELVQASAEDSLYHYSIDENTTGFVGIRVDEFSESGYNITVASMHSNYREYVFRMLSN